MKINHRFLLLGLLIATVLSVAFLGIQNLKQAKELKSKKSSLVVLKQQLEAQKELLKTDALLVEGKFEDALERYENHDVTDLNDSEFGIGLRRAIAQKFLKYEENLKLQRALETKNVDSTSTIVEIPSFHTAEELDSLSFVLTKTKMQLAKMKHQLHQKSFGEYVTFINGKGSQVHYVGQVVEGKANGHGIAILNTGSRYVGQWRNNERHGQGTFYWKDGEYYEGNYESDKRNGQGTYFWPNGEKYVGQWKNDQRSGKGAFFGKDGKLLTKGIWENDEMITKTTKPKKQRSKSKEVVAL